MIKPLVIFAEQAPKRHGSAEWFPGFNTFFMEKYISKHHKYIVAPCKNSRVPSKIFQWENYIARINANNIIILNPNNNKCIAFTTFYHLQHFFSNNRELINSTDFLCHSGHYNDGIINIEWPKQHQDKIKPWYFRPHFWGKYLLQDFKYNPTKNQCFFRGIMIKNSRKFIQILQSKNIPSINVKIGKLKPQLYAQELTSSICAVNAPGVRDMCYRDIDNFAMGIPSIRPKFTSKMLIEIPEDVYLPINHQVRPATGRFKNFSGMPLDHNELAEQVIDKWSEVNSDQKLLNQISQNAQDFFNQNFTNEIIAERSIQLMSDFGIFNS